MYSQSYGDNKGYWGERVANNHSPIRNQRKRSIYLESAAYYKKYSGNVTRVAPANGQNQNQKAVYECLKPMMVLMQGLGIFPIAADAHGEFKIRPATAAYSAAVFLFFAGFVGYIRWDNVETFKSAEGKFEEAVIDYLFSVYFLPLIMVPISWQECKKMALVLNDWVIVEDYYKKVAGKKLVISHGNMPLLIALVIPIVSCGVMIVTHITMAHFELFKVW